MEFIESLAGRLAAGLIDTVAPSPIAVIAVVVASLLLFSGLAARMIEWAEGWSESVGRIRHIATNRLQAMPAVITARRRYSATHLRSAQPTVIAEEVC